MKPIFFSAASVIMGVIYGFQDKKGVYIYIGSTIGPSNEREAEHHRADSFLNTYVMQRGGFQNFPFVVLKVTKASKEDIKYLERMYVDKYKPICNLKAPIRTQEERDYALYSSVCLMTQKQSEEECLKAIKV